MEQPKKPGPGKDIADLKARLGLAKGPAAAPARPGAPPVPGPSAIPNPLVPPPMAPSPFAPPPAPMGMGVPSPVPATAPVAAPAAAPRFDDPFAAMRPPEGKHFDFAADDGKPAVTVRRKTAAASMIILGVAVLVAGAIGFGFGASAVGRRAYNQANFGAKRVKTELDDMNKTVTQIAVAVQMSQQRLAAAKQDPSGFDYKLVEDLEMVKLDPRPDTSRIFKVNYYLLEDLAIDRLMNYYYDTIALFGEVERHIKRTKADKSALEAFATKEASKGGGDPSKQVNYGVVFDSRGKLAIASMVEVGKPVCKGGGEGCDAKELEGFQIRSNTGANWTPRKVGPKPEGDKVVPIEKTPLFEAVMSGSPEQVRMEQYKQRYNNIRLILQRLSATKKELNDAMDKAASRPDLVSPMSKICG